MKAPTTLIDLGDGSDRVLRDVQVQALNWLEKYIPTNKQLFINAPTGSGKSFMTRTLQRYENGPIVCPNNILARDYVNNYPSLNLLIGKNHYKCADFSSTCVDAKLKLNYPGHMCRACPLSNSRERFYDGESSVCNPMSLYFHKKLHGAENNIAYVDEAHACLSLIRTITQSKIKLSKDEMGMGLTHELNLIPYLHELIEASQKSIISAKTEQTIHKHETKIAKLELMILGLETEAEKYSIWLDHETNELFIMPIKVPRHVLKKILGPRSVFFSATLFKPDIDELSAGDDYAVLDLQSPIPLKNRLINFLPASGTTMKYGQTDVKRFVEHLENLIEEYGKDKRVLIHSTYALSQQMAEYWRIPVIVHDKETKADELNGFLQNGGVLVGSGMSEGLDLRNELCELNIVTKLQYPHVQDPFTRKRSALVDGRVWMLCETLKHLMQACGRGVRNETDKCKTIITDDRFASFTSQCDKLNLIPRYFKDSLRWIK